MVDQLEGILLEAVDDFLRALPSPEDVRDWILETSPQPEFGVADDPLWGRAYSDRPPLSPPDRRLVILPGHIGWLEFNNLRRMWPLLCAAFEAVVEAVGGEELDRAGNLRAQFAALGQRMSEFDVRPEEERPEANPDSDGLWDLDERLRAGDRTQGEDLLQLEDLRKEEDHD